MLRLRRRAWASPLVTAEPPLTYPEWVRAAGDYPDQDRVWLFHEHHARSNGWATADGHDLGGEA